MHHFRTLMRLHRALGHGLRQKNRQMGKGLHRGGLGLNLYSTINERLGHGIKKIGGGRKLSFRY